MSEFIELGEKIFKLRLRFLVEVNTIKNIS
jgi:hypothetical protein